jgi:hypothetical protein
MLIVERIVYTVGGRKVDSGRRGQEDCGSKPAPGK